MTATPFEEESGRGLRLFLVGVRVVGLITAILLTGLHSAPIQMKEQLEGLGPYITLGFLVYHAALGTFSLRARKPAAYVIIFCDVAVGILATYLFSQAHFLLVFTLPVLELAAFSGHLAAFFGAFIGIIFYAVLYALPLSELEAPELLAQLQLSGVQGALSVLLIWLYSLAVAEQDRRRAFFTEVEKEKEHFYQTLEEKRAEVGKMYGVVGERQAEVMAMNEEVLQLREQLEMSYRDLAEANRKIQRRTMEAEETRNRAQEELEKERNMLESQAVRHKRKLDQKTRLLEIFGQVAGTLSIDETLLALVFHLQSLFNSQVCVIFILDEVDGHQQLFPEVADAPDTEYFRNLVLELGQEAPGWAVLHNKSVKIDDEVAVIDGQELRALPGQGASAMVVPLTTAVVHGAVYLGRDEPDAYSPHEFNFLNEFCELASMAVGNALEFKNRISRGLEDSVTGLYNGLFLEERTREEVRRGRRYTYPVSLLLVDVDGFNRITEQGDDEVAVEVLRQISAVIRSAIRETDVPARIEGDDFGILLVHSDRNNAFSIGERIRSEVEAREFGPNRLRISVSVGVAGTPHDASNDDQLRARATQALDNARGYGGNKVAFFDT